MGRFNHLPKSVAFGEIVKSAKPFIPKIGRVETRSMLILQYNLR